VGLTLTNEEFVEVNRILASFKVKGESYGEMMAKMVNKD
jgi:hypothetical protein